MDALETLVRDVLHEHATEAPTDVPAVVDRRRRWPYALVAAVLVAGLAVAVVVLRGGGSTPTAAIPAGYKPISYHGITVAVPKDLPIVISSCGAAENAVMVSDGVAHGCLAYPSRYTRHIDTVISLDSAPFAMSHNGRAITIGGNVPALRSSGRATGGRARLPTGTITIESLDVSVSVLSPSLSVIDTVLGSIRITPVDAVGCPDHLSGAFNRPEGGAAPTSVSVCEYGIGSRGRTEWLVASGKAHQHDFAALAGDSRHEPDPGYPTPFVGVFRYADGARRFVPLDLSGLVRSIVFR